MWCPCNGGKKEPSIKANPLQVILIEQSHMFTPSKIIERWVSLQCEIHKLIHVPTLHGHCSIFCPNPMDWPIHKYQYNVHVLYNGQCYLVTINITNSCLLYQLFGTKNSHDRFSTDNPVLELHLIPPCTMWIRLNGITISRSELNSICIYQQHVNRKCMHWF